MPLKRKRMPLLLFSFAQMERIGKRMEFIGRPLSYIHFALEEELEALDIRVKASWYAGSAFLSALIYGMLFGGFFYVLLFLVKKEDGLLAAALGILFFTLAFLLHIAYPSILQKKIVEKENYRLLFALREIVMNVKSGATLFEAIRQIARGDYGHVSESFSEVVENIEAGMLEREALKNAALKSKNDYFSRAIWQIINALDSGASVADSLAGIVASLEKVIYRRIATYTSNLNFIMLIYMLIAAAIPSLGVTFMILLSVFTGAGIEKNTIFMLVGVSFVLEIMIIGYAHSTRPGVFGG
ncbi:MAG TPA: type II secretion system F family protein [Candidatus Bilamarchaeaceae archaeon]|nr:type II secretion system F family protein [Candidatus Bilamarchaeaceae archaeon]